MSRPSYNNYYKISALILCLVFFTCKPDKESTREESYYHTPESQNDNNQFDFQQIPGETMVFSQFRSHQFYGSKANASFKNT